MKKIIEILNRPYIKWTLFSVFTLYPNIDFWLGKFHLWTENANIDWSLVGLVVPRLLYGLVTGLLFLLYIKSQSAYYEVQDVQKELLRLNQLYKERFKMIKFGDGAKLFSKDFEKRLWKNRLLLKEPNNAKEVNEYIESQYRFTHFDYADKSIPASDHLGS
jgi:hypothetical protein